MTPTPFRPIDLSKPPPTDLDVAASLLETAAAILRRHGDARIDSASWRAADALLLLSGLSDDLPGCHHPTGWLRCALTPNQPSAEDCNAHD